MRLSPLFFARAIFALLLGAVTWLTLTPSPEDADAGLKIMRWIANVLLRDSALGDKVAHFTAYAALGASAFWARLGASYWPPLVLAGYGAALEVVQGMGGVRSPELADGLANIAGAVAGYVAAVMVTRFLSKAAAS